MTAYSDLPWPRINDYLLEIGTIRDNKEFSLRVLECLNSLVPFDADGVYVTINTAGEVGVRSSIAGSSKWVELYNNYYWKTQPDTGPIVDWRQWRDTEYVADFIEPQGIGFTAGLLLGDSDGGFVGGFAIHRSKNSSCFSEQERLILEVLHPHISNFHSINTLLATCDIRQLPDAATLAADYQCLTKREAEIAALLCRKYQTGMIATRLLISPLTVYRHVANIFTKFNVFSREELVEKLLRNK